MLKMINPLCGANSRQITGNPDKRKTDERGLAVLDRFRAWLLEREIFARPKKERVFHSSHRILSLAKLYSGFKVTFAIFNS